MTRKQPPDFSLFPFHLPVQTRWDDNDIYGHLNNTVHYRLFDTAVNCFLIDHHMLDFHQGKTVYLVVETSCTYFAELAYPDELIVGLGVSHLGNSSVAITLPCSNRERAWPLPLVNLSMCWWINIAASQPT